VLRAWQASFPLAASHSAIDGLAADRAVRSALCRVVCLVVCHVACRADARIDRNCSSQDHLALGDFGLCGNDRVWTLGPDHDDARDCGGSSLAAHLMAVGVAEVVRGVDWRSRMTRMNVRGLSLGLTQGEEVVAAEVVQGDRDLGRV